MKEGIKATIRGHFPDLPDDEIQSMLEEIEKECQGLSVEEIAGCVYRKIGEMKAAGKP